MGRWIRVLPVLLLLIVVPVIAQTSTGNHQPSPLLIIEIQTGSDLSANDEFVEIYNQTDEVYPADKLKLQYRSATGVDWLTKATLEGVVEPRGRYLIATSGLSIDANIVNGLGLAAGGGHLRILLMSSEGEVSLDQLAWGNAQFAFITPAVAPLPGQSLKRQTDEDGYFVDTDNDSQDFTVSATPSPEFTPVSEVEEPEKEPNNPETPTQTGNDEANQPAPSPSGNRNYAKIEISELLPDPDKPLTDAEDEFVELYNPNSEAVDLEGYVIETGSKYSYDFVIPNITIKAKQYLAFYSLDTGLALSNSGGGARILAPNKSPLYEAPVYEKAKPDIVWANIGGTWQWSAKPTPNAPNIAAATAASAGSGGANGGRTYLSQGRTLAATDDGRNIYEEPLASTDNQVDTAVVAGVGAMALLYAGNEYRYDISNFFQKFRRYFASRRGVGS